MSNPAHISLLDLPRLGVPALEALALSLAARIDAGAPAPSLIITLDRVMDALAAKAAEEPRGRRVA